MSEITGHAKSYEPYPLEEVEPVRVRLKDPELRTKVVQKWIATAIEHGYRQRMGWTPAEFAADIAGFAVLEYRHITSLVEGKPWTTSSAPPNVFAEMIAEIDQSSTHG